MSVFSIIIEERVFRHCANFLRKKLEKVPPSLDCFRLENERFVSVKLLFRHYKTFRKKILEKSFLVVGKPVFESYGVPLRVFCGTVNSINLSQ